MTAKNQLTNWLANDDLQKVLQGFFSLAEKYKDEQLRNNATFQSGRLKALEEKRLKNMISLDNDNIEAAKIRNALLQIIQGLPEGWNLDEKTITSVPFAVSSENWKKYAAYFMATVALLAGLAELSGYSIRDLFTNQNQPVKSQPFVPNANTTGEKSPAIITHDGDVNINYGESNPNEDSTKTTKTPPQ